MVTIITGRGIVDSFENHLDIYIHSKNNSIDENEVFETVTSLIFSSENMSERASHVFVGDFKNHTLIRLIEPCQDEIDSINLLPAEKYSQPDPQSDWVTLGSILVSYFLFSIIVMFILSELSYIRNLRTFLTRRTTHMSSTNVSKFRVTESIVSTLHIPSEIAYKSPIYYSNWRIPTTELLIDFMNILGKGSSATIYKAYLNAKSPLSMLAPKLETQHFQRCPVAVKASLCYNFLDPEQLNNEIKTMITLGHHKNICAFLGWSMARELPCLVFELVESDLLKWSKSFRESETIPPIKEVYRILWQVANGMMHISQHKLVHRDLAARNVLLTTDLRVKITDFGLCCNCDQSYTYAGSVTKKLPIKWLSPEAILDRIFSEKSDVWSFGILIFEVVSCGIIPYSTLSNEEMLEFIRKGGRLEAPNGTPEEL